MGKWWREKMSLLNLLLRVANVRPLLALANTGDRAYYLSHGQALGLGHRLY